MNRLTAGRAIAMLALAVIAATTAQAALPPTGFGCYANYEEVGGLANWPAHVALMKQAGMNTFALFCRDATSLQEQVDVAVEAGMLEKAVPIFVVSNCGPDAYREALGGDEAYLAAKANDPDPPPGFAPGDMDGYAAVIRAAKAQARHPEGWPEIVAYNYDEPGHGEADWDGQRFVRAITYGYNARGLRCGTAVCHPHVKDLVAHLDVVCVNVIIGGDLRGCKKLVEAMALMEGSRKAFWVYDIHTQGMMPTAIRRHVGFWTWLVQPQCRLSWSWLRYLGEQADMAKPQMNARLRAYANGRRDFEHFQLVMGLGKSLGRTRMGMLAEWQSRFDWEGFPVEQFAGGQDWKAWEPPAETFIELGLPPDWFEAPLPGVVP